MALIKCPECGKEISDKAQICPGCGIKIDNENKDFTKTKKKRQKTVLGKILLACVILIIIFAIGVFLLCK